MENVNEKTPQSKDQERKPKLNTSECSLAEICFRVKNNIF